MTDLDHLLKQSLDPELAETLTQEESLRDEIAETFKGKQRWMTIGWIADLVGCLSLMIVSIYKIASTDDVRTCLLSFLAIGFLKLWYWMYMSRNKILREIKRLELGVAIMHQSATQNK